MVEVLYGVECLNPQTYYDGLQKSLHQEWYFVQRIATNIGEAFHPVQ